MIIIYPLAVFLVVVSSWGIAQAKNPPPIHNPGCLCSRKHHKIRITSTIWAALDGGAGDYPRQFHNDEGFKFPFNDACNAIGAQLFEYPLVKRRTYVGGYPSFERVIYMKVSRGVVKARYCGCVYHPRGEGKFRQCQDLGESGGETGDSKETKAKKETGAGKKTKDERETKAEEKTRAKGKTKAGGSSSRQ